MSDEYFVYGKWRRKEHAVIDLWEAGKAPKDIAENMGIPVAAVSKILLYMRENKADQVQSPTATGRSTAALLAALRRHHPERCSA